jgi:hypothetical protein
MPDLLQFAIVMFLLVGMPLGIIFVGGPLAKALVRRTEGGRGELDPALLEELERLRAEVAGLRELPVQLAELQERVDFTERLLTQSREHERLPGTLH